MRLLFITLYIIANFVVNNVRLIYIFIKSCFAIQKHKLTLQDLRVYVGFKFPDCVTFVSSANTKHNRG